MRIVACCKGIPVEPTVASLRIQDADVQFIDTDFYINEADSYALEVAIFFKNTYGAETFAITVGPLRSQEALYIALAKGIDNAIRIDEETLRPENVALNLISVIKELAPDIILFGIQSEDWMGGQVGIYVAQELGAAVAFAVTEICELGKNFIRVKREIGGGRVMHIKVSLPAILCVQTGIFPLRYVSAVKRQKVREFPIKSVNGVSRHEIVKGIGFMGSYEFKRALVPQKTRQVQIVEGEREEKARKIVELIQTAI